MGKTKNVALQFRGKFENELAVEITRAAYFRYHKLITETQEKKLLSGHEVLVRNVDAFMRRKIGVFAVAASGAACLDLVAAPAYKTDDSTRDIRYVDRLRPWDHGRSLDSVANDDEEVNKVIEIYDLYVTAWNEANSAKKDKKSPDTEADDFVDRDTFFVNERPTPNESAGDAKKAPSRQSETEDERKDRLARFAVLKEQADQEIATYRQLCLSSFADDSRSYECKLDTLRIVLYRAIQYTKLYSNFCTFLSQYTQEEVVTDQHDLADLLSAIPGMTPEKVADIQRLLAGAKLAKADKPDKSKKSSASAAPAASGNGQPQPGSSATQGPAPTAPQPTAGDDQPIVVPPVDLPVPPQQPAPAPAPQPTKPQPAPDASPQPSTPAVPQPAPAPQPSLDDLDFLPAPEPKFSVEALAKKLDRAGYSEGAQRLLEHYTPTDLLSVKEYNEAAKMFGLPILNDRTS